MDESAPVRAIMIGASLFVTIATITAVLTYYNTAKDMVKVIGTGTDIGQVYSDYVEESLLKTSANTYLTGTEVINILNYFYDSDLALVYINSYVPLGTSLDENGSTTSWVSKYSEGSMTKGVNKLTEDEFNKLKESINPNGRFKLSRTNVDYKVKIVLRQEI